MSNQLKIKLNVFEKRLAMQIIDQDKNIIGSIAKPIEFKASNGIVLVSSNRPGLYPELKEISLRGQDSSADLDIVYGKFNSTEEAEEFLAKLEVAFNEFIEKINEDKLRRLAKIYNEPIDLGDVVVSFSPINNGFVMELLKSNIKEPKEGLVDYNNLRVEFKDNKANVYLPFNTEDSFQCLVNKKSINKDNLESHILMVIKTLVKKSEIINKDMYSERLYMV